MKLKINVYYMFSIWWWLTDRAGSSGVEDIWFSHLARRRGSPSAAREDRGVKHSVSKNRNIKNLYLNSKIGTMSVLVVDCSENRA